MSSSTNSSSFENPCNLVRKSCREWMEGEGLTWSCPDEEQNGKRGRRSVRIRREKLRGLADDIRNFAAIREDEKELRSRQHLQEENDETLSSWIEWDSEGWHYSGEGFRGTEIQRRERVALYLLALDAINFCFWPVPETKTVDPRTASKDTKNISQINSLEYDHLAIAMKKMAEADHNNAEDTSSSYLFSPNNLASTTAERMEELFEQYMPSHSLPNISKRADLWKEVGNQLLECYQSSALTFLEAAGGSASGLVQLVAETFEGFRDQVTLPNIQQPIQLQRVVFLKRAQIFVGDVNAALRLQLSGMERLTTFADYRVPQLLRHCGVLEYSSLLADSINNNKEFRQGSPEEISIRAATVLAVEELTKLLNQQNTKEICGASQYTDVTIDWYLWQVGELMHQEGKMKPFHKVRTHFY